MQIKRNNPAASAKFFSSNFVAQTTLLLVVALAGNFSTQTTKAGALVGTLTELSHDDVIDLTTLGSLDWTVYGLGGNGVDNGSLTPDSRKAAGGGNPVSTISELTLLTGTEALTDGGQFGFAPLFSWSDGAPIAAQVAEIGDETADAALMIRNQEPGTGFSFSLPADTTERSALIYVGAFRAQGQLHASLSDSSSFDFLPPTFYHGTGVDRVAVYRLDYLANSPGQTLDVRWEQTVDQGNFNMISLSAIALTTPDNLPSTHPNSLFETGAAVGNTAGGVATTGGAISTAAADLNLDGIPEIITAATSDSSDPHFRIHTRNASNSWDSIDLRTTNHVANNRLDRFAGDSMIFDMNGDTYPDILLPESSNSAGAGKVSWFENPGNSALTGTWAERVIETWNGNGGANSPAHMSEIMAGDMDGDGDVDIVTRDVNNGVHILRNDGGGSYSRHFLATNPREGLDLFDPDHDGDLDILLNGVWFEAPDPGAGPADLSNTSSFTQHEIVPFGDNNSPWYPDEVNNATMSDYASKVMAVDLNDDGLEDVVITNSEELSIISADEKPEGLTVYLADGVGGDAWIEVQVQTDSSKLHTLDVADVDLDGDLDLLSGVSTVGQGTEPAEVFVYLNEGDATSWTKLTVDDVNIYSGIFVDYDNDGDADIAGPDHWNSGQLRFFQSNATTLLNEPLLPGDYNDDGLVNAADLAEWQARFGTTVADAHDCADGDGDQNVDGHDFVIWQRRFGQSLNSPATGTVVPEPSVGGLLCVGLLLLSRYLAPPSTIARSQTQVNRAERHLV